MSQSVVFKNAQHFEEIHVISDLHLGGEGKFQIFNSGKILSNYINHLSASNADQPSTQALALIINGDFIDFLAHADTQYLDPQGAIATLKKIKRDPAFSAVWQALAKFVKTPSRTLVIVLGNHDLELALPWVQQWLINDLAGQDATNQIMFSCEGAGFACKVGNKKVLCVHGNEVDTANLTDYEQLRQITRDLSFNNHFTPWTPNMGTKLVIDVMNEVKRKFPFVDLLKPEISAVIPTLIAIEPDKYDYINRHVLPLGSRFAIDKIKAISGYLSADDPIESSDDEVEAGLNQLLTAHSYQESDKKNEYQALLHATEIRLEDNDNPLDLIGSDQQAEYLGYFSALIDRIRKKPPEQILRNALEGLLKDKSFDVETEDGTFKKLDKKISADIDFIIAGHTHFERALKRENGRGHYFNTGTWIRLIKYTQAMLRDDQVFSAVYNALKIADIRALDEGVTVNNQHYALAETNPTVACIKTEDGRTTGLLLRIGHNGQVSDIIKQF